MFLLLPKIFLPDPWLPPIGASPDTMHRFQQQEAEKAPLSSAIGLGGESPGPESKRSVVIVFLFSRDHLKFQFNSTIFGDLFSLLSLKIEPIGI